VTNTNEATVLNTGSGNTSAWTYFGFGFTAILSNLPDYTSLTNTFDQYRIIWMKLEILPFYNQATASITGEPPSLIGNLIVDRDDAALPTASDSGAQVLREYASFRQWLMFSPRPGPFVVTVTHPKVAVAAYQGAFTAYANQSTWVDSAYPAVQHYGIKGLFKAFSPTPNSAFVLPMQLTWSAMLEFRDVR